MSDTAAEPDEEEEDAQDPEQAKKDHDELLALLFLLLLKARKGMDADLGDLMVQVGRGEVMPLEAGTRGLKILEEFHTEAASLGRRLAVVEDDEQDGVLGAAVAAAEAGYLARFVVAIRTGKYGGLDTGEELDEEGIRARAELYGGKLLGTANTGFVNHMPDTTLWHWIDSGDAPRECGPCQSAADGSPYTNETLSQVGVPGDGQTCEGGALCRCTLQTSDELRAFTLDEWEALEDGEHED